MLGGYHSFFSDVFKYTSSLIYSNSRQSSELIPIAIDIV